MPALLLLCLFYFVSTCVTYPSGVQIDDNVFTIGTSISQGIITHEDQTLFTYTGRGMLTYFWFAGNWQGLNETIFTITIDNKYEMPFSYYLGMGIGFGNEVPWGVPLMGKGSITSAVYNTYHIPFFSTVKITARLADCVQETHHWFWFVVRGVAGITQVTLSNGFTLPDGAQLHLYTVEEKLLKPFEFVDIFASNGSGAVLQMTMMAISGYGNTHYMEGCMRAYLYESTNEFEDPFTLLSSGTEDYFSSAWGFAEMHKGETYHFPIGGLTYISHDRGRFSAYKVHTDDPLIFSKKRGGMRMRWRNGDTVDLLTGAKCVDLHGVPKGVPANTTVTFSTWVYEW